MRSSLHAHCGRPLLVAFVVVLLAGCGPATDGNATAGDRTSPATAGDGQPTPGGAVESGASTEPAAIQEVPVGSRLAVRVIGTRPHDETAFTQGYEFADGRLFESRGLYAGQEDVILTEVDPADGAAVREVQRPTAEPDCGPRGCFYEGLTVVGDRLIQLTWQAGVAYGYDVETLTRTGEFAYEGEGWGLCDQPDRLVMSNGTSELTFRDLETFEEQGRVTVDLSAYRTDDLNELECVDGLVWANLWNTDLILVIDPDTGEVVSEVDVSTLADDRGRSLEDPEADVLNGIAYDEATGTWLLTGKLWPTAYEVTFDCVEGCTTVTPSHYMRPDDPPPTRLS
jgi:glutamine cyclotransferase